MCAERAVRRLIVEYVAAFPVLTEKLRFNCSGQSKINFSKQFCVFMRRCVEQTLSETASERRNFVIYAKERVCERERKSAKRLKDIIPKYINWIRRVINRQFAAIFLSTCIHWTAKIHFPIRSTANSCVSIYEREVGIFLSETWRKKQINGHFIATNVIHGQHLKHLPLVITADSFRKSSKAKFSLNRNRNRNKSDGGWQRANRIMRTPPWDMTLWVIHLISVHMKITIIS